MSNKFWNIRRHLVEIKIGSFFLAAILLLFFTLISIREIKFFKGTYLLHVKFKFAEGLRPASPVRFCGVDVGEVKDVEVRKENNLPIVIVHTKVQKDVHIPKGSAFFINSLSLFGEKYMEITPPEDPALIAGYFDENSSVEGWSPIPLFHVFQTFDKTMKEVREFVQEGKIKTSVENILANVEDTTFEIKGMVQDLRSKEGTLGKLIYDDSLYNEVRNLFRDARNPEGTLGKLMYDATLYNSTEEFIRELKEHPWKLLYRPKEKDKKTETEKAQ